MTADEAPTATLEQTTLDLTTLKEMSVTALTKKRWLLGVAGIFLAAGLLFGVSGFLNWNIHADALVSWLA